MSTHVLELDYEESSPIPGGWVLDLNSGNHSGDLYFCDYENPTPCIAHIDGDLYDDDLDFDVGVWSDATWVYVQGPFVLYVTLFYGQQAPEHWSFIRGDR